MTEEIASPSQQAEHTARRTVNTLTLAGLAVLWALFALWAYNMHRDHRMAVEQVIDRQRAAVTEHVDGVFRMAETFMVLANRWVSDHPGRDPRVDPGFVEMVKDFQQTTNASMLVRLAEADGTLRLIPETPGAKPANIADRDYFKAAMQAKPGEIYISAPFQGRATGRWAVSVATRFAEPSHGAAIIFVAIELSIFDNAFLTARIGEQGSVSLLRRDGVLLARSAATRSELGKNLSGSVIFTEGLATAKEGVMFTKSLLTDGIPKLIAFGAMNTYPLVITVGLPLEAIDRETLSDTIRGALVMLLFSLLSALARWKIASLIDNLAASRRQLVIFNEQLEIEIEERRQAESALRRQAKLVGSLLDASTDAIMLFKTDGTLLAVNSVMAGRFQRKVEDLSGVCLWDIFPPEVTAARRKAVAQVIETGLAAHFLDKRGGLYLDNHIYPVVNDEGMIDQVAIYSRDITEQKMAESKLALYVSEVERSNAELEQFAYVASHDLREPLRMVSSYVDLLERRYGPSLDDAGRDFIHFAKDGALRMNALVNDLLEVSRIGRADRNLSRLEMGEPLAEALTNLHMAIAECGAEISVPETMPTLLVCREEMIRLFQNLVANALKYRADDRPCRIEVACEEAGAFWSFTVKDNGIGINEAYFDKIFRIFQRLHGRNDFGGGSGIGLAICKKIVERHGGGISVESDGLSGSNFRFTLPRN